ncbi:MAG TPA: hypothetical protein VNP92_12405, partial [Actinophytocola sp.]|nr:hypothetical protein [Actinophytocola sp.]
MKKPDLPTMREDDLLLDRLGQGEPTDLFGSQHPLADDAVEAMLASWRATLPAADPPDQRLVDAVVAAVAPTPVRKGRRLVRASLGAAATVALLGGGVAVAAAYAGPDSPLWPVTQLVYTDVAESRAAQHGASRAVTDARTAADQHRYTDAAKLLAEADLLVDKVDEPGEAGRIRADIATVRDRLPADASDPSSGGAGPADPTESLGVDPPPLGPGQERERGRGAEHPGPNGNHGNGEDGPGQGNGTGDPGHPDPDKPDKPKNP